MVMVKIRNFKRFITKLLQKTITNKINMYVKSIDKQTHEHDKNIPKYMEN
jgi:hypothetical protein